MEAVSELVIEQSQYWGRSINDNKQRQNYFWPSIEGGASNGRTDAGTALH